MSVDVKYAFERALGLCGLKELKEKQKEALLVFKDEDDVFVSLPTGYGKSIIYGILPLTDTLSSETKTFTIFFIEVPCNFFLFTLNVPSERFASQSQQSAVVISYTVCIIHNVLGHAHSHVLIALALYLSTTRSLVVF